MKAVIFDMDGVIIDSEPFWQKAEFEVFSSLGVALSAEFTNVTKTMTTIEVTRFWYEKYPWDSKTLEEVEEMVITRVMELIEQAGGEIKGIEFFIKKLKSNGFKIGLATNSPYKIIPVVLEKTGIAQYFDSIFSAEFVEFGKPDPAIYLMTSKELGIDPENCIVIEDSYSGMMAAKKAGMKVVAFTNGNQDVNLSLADYKMESFLEQELHIFS
ncbi:hexitol phosphatase HxpB [Flavobacterium sp. SLB02]|uniref:hexitol phosphatase HxpB n=1 Tax=Flavobacterium sp. SLB02 TaxID=2665645 RepID=UPI0012A83A25|nr:hexitol phosphatase HxpB [Flavobacterium sp. SLB02]QGK74390.1 hexitol phosphatase HxpB [Flavobacterium sp. SLB02]